MDLGRHHASHACFQRLGHGRVAGGSHTDETVKLVSPGRQRYRGEFWSRMGHVFLVNPEAVITAGQAIHLHHQWLNQATQGKNTNNFISRKAFFKSAHLQETFK